MRERKTATGRDTLLRRPPEFRPGGLHGAVGAIILRIGNAVPKRARTDAIQARPLAALPVRPRARGLRLQLGRVRRL